MTRHFSLRRKLLYSLFGVTVLSFFLVCLMAYKTNEFIDVGRKTAVSAASKDIMDKIDRMLFERSSDVQAFSISESARSGDPTRLIPFMNDMVAAFTPTYELMVATDKHGKVIAVNTVGKDGRALDSARLLGKDMSTAPWFVEAIQGKPSTGAAWVSDTAWNDELSAVLGKKKVISFTAPIRRSSGGEILGVWTNRVSWEAVENILKNSKSSMEEEAQGAAFLSLIGKDGGLLFSTERELSDNLKKYRKDELPAASASLIRKSSLILPHFQGSVFESLTPSRGFSTFAGLGWVMMVQMPSADPMHRFNLGVTAVSLVLVMVAFLLASMTITRMVRGLQGVIFSLSHESRELKQASSQLTMASQELASSATQQSASLQETASSVEEISSMVSRSAENASRSLKMANTSHETASRGKKVIGDLVGAIEQISGSNGSLLAHIEVSNKRFAEIISVISEIGEKTKVINDIVFQTKLLSFNASVEAARAGEHGKGFAVVAEEVGSLAQMSGNAAKEISTLLSRSEGTVQRIVDETQSQVERLVSDGKTKIEIGLNVAEQCGTVLEEIVHNEAQVNAMLEEIATASNEQAQGIGEITRAIAQLDQVTNQNVRIAQKTADFASMISRRYQALREQVGSLESIVRGRRQTRKKVSAGTKPESSEREHTAASPGGGATVIPLRRDASAMMDTPTREVPSESDPRFREV